MSRPPRVFPRGAFSFQPAPPAADDGSTMANVRQTPRPVLVDRFGRVQSAAERILANAEAISVLLSPGPWVLASVADIARVQAARLADENRELLSSLGN